MFFLKVNWEYIIYSPKISPCKCNVLIYAIFCFILPLQDPEFYQYLKEHDKELLEFDDEDIDVGYFHINFHTSS